MSPPISFTPSRPQPFTLEEAMLLEIDTLVAGMSFPYFHPTLYPFLCFFPISSYPAANWSLVSSSRQAILNLRYDTDGTAEITRLENSIIHLRSTQSQLLAYLEEEPSGDEDGEIKAAVTENEGVM